ncbi:MAG: plasmid pRiA4b ORF-3 family protein [Tuberibacillus sp.]
MIYQFKINLRGFKPPIWRRIQVDSRISFYEFHHVIQIAFAWENAHLHEFMFKEAGQHSYFEGVSIGMVQDDEDMWSSRELIDERKVTLSKFFKNEKDRCLYVYDFGEDWEHEIVLEKVMEDDPNIKLPRCLKAMRLAPYEDSRSEFENDKIVNNKELTEEINEDLEKITDFMRLNEDWFDEGPEEEQASLKEFFQQVKMFHEYAPWKFLNNDQLIAVYLSEVNEWFFCSVLGTAGREYGLVAYIGDEGLENLRKIYEGDVDIESLEKSQKSLFLSYSSAHELTPIDVDFIEMGGVLFEDKKAWPSFRSHMPGYFPWYLDENEAYHLFRILQILNHTFSTVDEENLRGIPSFHDGTLFALEEEGKAVLLHVDQIQTPKKAYPLFVSEFELKSIQKKLKVNDLLTIEFDSFYHADPVQDVPSDRPYYPNVVVAMDTNTGMVIHFEVLNPEDFEKGLQKTFLFVMDKLKNIPGFVLLTNENVMDILKPLINELGIQAEMVDELPYVNELKGAFPSRN